jgi:hypothetical protein
VVGVGVGVELGVMASLVLVVLEAGLVLLERVGLVELVEVLVSGVLFVFWGEVLLVVVFELVVVFGVVVLGVGTILVLLDDWVSFLVFVGVAVSVVVLGEVALLGGEVTLVVLLVVAACLGPVTFLLFLELWAVSVP